MNPNSRIIYSVRPADWRDLNALRKLEEVCFKDDAWSMWDLIGVLTFPGIVRFKAVVNEELVGFIAGDQRGDDGNGWITTVGVLPQYRRQGIAQALLDVCEGLIKAERVRLCVRVGNQGAVDLYLKRGYQQVDIWKGYYPNEEDALVLEKRR